MWFEMSYALQAKMYLKEFSTEALDIFKQIDFSH